MQNPDTSALLLDIAIKVALTIFGFFLGLSSKRPRLQLGGSSSGGFAGIGTDLMATSVSIYNRPSFFGIAVNRDAATIVSARIYDPGLKEFVGPSLTWRNKDSLELLRECSINSGRQAEVFLFAKERHAEAFFVFAPSRANEAIATPLNPKYSENRLSLSLVLFDVNNRKHTFELVVRNHPQGVHVMSRYSNLRARWEFLRRAVGPM